MKARQDAVADTSKDDEEEVLRKREERDAAKRKDEKVRGSFPDPVGDVPLLQRAILPHVLFPICTAGPSTGRAAAGLSRQSMSGLALCLQACVISRQVSLFIDAHPAAEVALVLCHGRRLLPGAADAEAAVLQMPSEARARLEHRSMSGIWSLRVCRGGWHAKGSRK